MIRAGSGQSIGAQMTNATTGADFTGTVTVYVTGDAGTQAIGSVGSGICTHEGNGYHTYRPASTETDYALIAFTFIGAGAITRTIQVETVTTSQQSAVGVSSSASGAVTGNSLAQDALLELGILAAGETIGADDAAFCLGRLQRMIDTWAADRFTITTVAREVFNITSGTQTYTIGSGGTYNTVRPTSIERAAYLPDPAATIPIEIEIAVLSPQQYQAWPQKTLTGTYPQAVYCDFSWTAGLANLTILPMPSSSTPDLVLYLPKALLGFGDGTTSYSFPPGYAEALLYNLALRLCKPYSVPVDPDLKVMAYDSLAHVKQGNVRMVDLGFDTALVGGQYDINSDSVR